MRETGEEQTLLLQVRATVYAKISGRKFKEEQDPHGRKLFLPKYLLVTEEKTIIL